MIPARFRAVQTFPKDPDPTLRWRWHLVDGAGNPIAQNLDERTAKSFAMGSQLLDVEEYYHGEHAPTGDAREMKEKTELHLLVAAGRLSYVHEPPEFQAGFKPEEEAVKEPPDPAWEKWFEGREQVRETLEEDGARRVSEGKSKVPRAREAMEAFAELVRESLKVKRPPDE